MSKYGGNPIGFISLAVALVFGTAGLPRCSRFAFFLNQPVVIVVPARA